MKYLLRIKIWVQYLIFIPCWLSIYFLFVVFDPSSISAPLKTSLVFPRKKCLLRVSCVCMMLELSAVLWVIDRLITRTLIIFIFGLKPNSVMPPIESTKHFQPFPSLGCQPWIFSKTENFWEFGLWIIQRMLNLHNPAN